MTRKIIVVFCISIMVMMFTAGCTRREKPEDYLIKQLGNLNSENIELAEHQLNVALAKEDMEEFTEDLKEDYIKFICRAFDQIKYKVKSVEETNKNNYAITMTISPVDISDTATEAINDYLTQMKSSDELEEEKAALLIATEQLKEPKYANNVDVTIGMSWQSDHYEINERNIQSLKEVLVVNILYPYTMIAEAFAARNYVQVCLDMVLKGKIAEYAVLTDTGEDENLKQYNEIYEMSNEDVQELGATEEEKVRYENAIKEIAKVTPYEIGAPKKVGDNHFTVDVHITPNRSVVDCFSQINAFIDNGEIKSKAELKEAIMVKLESMATAPSLGEATTVTVNVERIEGFHIGMPEEDENQLYSIALVVE